MERHVAELGEDAHVNKPHVALHVGLVPGTAGAGGNQHGPVVVCHVLHHAVQGRLITVRLDHCRLQVVSHYHAGDTTYMPQALDCGMDKVLGALRGDEQQKTVIAGGERGNECLAADNLACLYIDIAHRVARKVQEQLLAAHALVCENGRGNVLLRSCVLVVVITELGEAVVVRRVVPLVLFPQQLQSDMLTRHLILKIRKKLLEHRETTVRVGRAATFQTVLQYGIVKGEKSIYAERVRVDFFHVVIDRLLVHADY